VYARQRAHAQGSSCPETHTIRVGEAALAAVAQREIRHDEYARKRVQRRYPGLTVKPRRRLLPFATGLLLLMAASSSADGTQTIDTPIPGLLIAVGPTQQTLTVAWNNARAQGCGSLVVAPSVVETATTVTVQLIAQVTQPVPAPETCAGDAEFGTLTATLASPLAGRAVNGLQLTGGALYSDYGPGATMPSLVGLSPYDARMMLSPMPADKRVPWGPVGLVDHHSGHVPGGALATVIAQRPVAGRLLPHRVIVVLTVAP
jgi:hypothetical protein